MYIDYTKLEEGKMVPMGNQAITIGLAFGEVRITPTGSFVPVVICQKAKDNFLEFEVWLGPVVFSTCDRCRIETSTSFPHNYPTCLITSNGNS